MPKYQNQEVKVRPARQGDKGFDQAKGEQVVVTMPDGSERTVPKSEVQGQSGQGQSDIEDSA